MLPHTVITRLAAVVLMVTGILKLLDSGGRDSYFREPDSLLYFLNHRQLLVLAASFELGVAAYVWLAKSLRQRGLTLLWFCSVVTLYKIGLHFTYDTKPCSCLGIAGKLLKLSSSELETVSWMLLGSMAAIALWTIVDKTGNQDDVQDLGNKRGVSKLT